MNAIGSVDEFIRIVRANPDIANIAGGCEEELISAAEELLGVRLPPSYRRFVGELGECDIAGQEFSGVWTRGDEPVPFGAVRTTLDARTSSAMPTALVAFMFDGMGGLYALDTANRDADDEGSVVVWEPGASMPGDRLEHIADNFGEFALRITQRALEAWRAN